MSTKSFNTKFDGFKKNWKNTREIKDVKITKIMFTIKSLKVRLKILNIFRNSIGINKINKDKQKRIRNQKRPWAFQVITDLVTKPSDSRSRYIE